MGSLGRELQQAVVSQRCYGLSSGSICFQAEDARFSACSFSPVYYVPLLISVVILNYALCFRSIKRKSKAIEDLLVINIEQNITGCLNSTFRHKNRETTKQLGIRLGRLLEKI